MMLREMQWRQCVDALREEIQKFSHSLVFLGSRYEYGILYPVVADERKWNKDREDDASIWWFLDDRSRNLFVYGDHPGYARRKRWYRAELTATLELARTHLPAFR
jgi:hypothetical protein